MRFEEQMRVVVGKRMRWLRCMVCGVAIGCVTAACCRGAGVHATVDTATPAKAHAQKKIVALSPWEQAEHGRDALDATPNEARTKAGYARTMDIARSTMATRGTFMRPWR